LLAVVFAEVEELDTRQMLGFAGPNDSDGYLDGIGKSLEREGETSDEIGFQAIGRRDEEAVFADIKQECLFGFVLVERKKDWGLRDSARIEAAFGIRGKCGELLSLRGHEGDSDLKK